MPDFRSPPSVKVGTDFRIDVPEIDCRVVFDSRLEHRGIVRNAVGTREIALREYDERVLLHEVLHRIIQTGNSVWVYDVEGHERLVQRLERGLWAMGWRWTERAEAVAA